MLIIEKLLEPFGFTFGQLQDTVTLLNHLKKNNVSIESFINYVEEKKIETAKIDRDMREKMEQDKLKWEQKVLKCPECNTVMSLFPVNTVPGDQTGDASKSVWACTNKKCMETIYNTQTIQEIVKGGS